MNRTIFLAMLTMIACQTKEVLPQGQTAELARSTTAKKEVVATNLQKDTLISPKGIKQAKLRMTLKELR